MTESDKDSLIAMLNRFGVGFKEEKTKDGFEVACEQGAAKVGGYMGFVTVFEFSRDGAFIKMGAWE